MDQLRAVADDIISLKIQGATNVALESVKAFAAYINRLDTDQPEESFLEKINTARDILINTRPTEPAMRNGLKKIMYDMHSARDQGIKVMEETALTSADEYHKLLLDTKEKCIQTGAALIEDGSTIMTHCHSSISSAIFVRAFEQGKNIQAICTETRPRYQGRKTARELVEAGIPTTQVVDSAMRWVIKEKSIDMIVIGLDAVTSQGTIFNKIGSRLLALAAKESDVPLYVAGSLLKFDGDTIFGGRTTIEMRDIEEITADWPDAPKGLKLVNPSFETVSRDLIDALITEEGVFAPELVFEVVRTTYPWMLQF